MSKPDLAQYYSEGGAGQGQGRRYKHPLTEEYAYGVTTISGRYSEGWGGNDGLAQYAADVTLRWANENWNLLGSRSDETNYRNGRFRWKDHTNHLAQVGTDAHEYIEADLTPGAELPFQWAEALEIAHQWVKLRQRFWLEPDYVEHTVWNHTYGYAGTFDFSGAVDGVPSLMDVKTGRLLRENNRLQQAALFKAEVLMVKHADGTWTEEPMPKWEQVGFIHLRPNYYNPVNGDTEQAFGEIEFMDMDEIDDLFEIFLGLLQGKKAEDRLKAHRKSTTQTEGGTA